MASTFIHPSTIQQLEGLITDLPQSLVITGPEGIGLSSAVEYISTRLKTQPLYVLPEKDDKVDLDKGVITVDIIRRLYGFTKTIETGKRLIVIDYAERMGTQAQNAFLKLLEEPGVNTHFILLTHSLSSLLTTIQSRVQVTTMAPITLTQSNTLLDELGVTDTTKRSQLLFIASGLPAQITLLANTAEDFDARAQIIRDARTYVQGSAYDRLKLALQYKDDREGSLTLLLDAMKLLRTSLRNKSNAHQVGTIDSLLRAYERIAANGNIRLHLAAAL